MRFKTYKSKEGKKCGIAIKRHFENKKVIFRMYYPNVVEPHYYIPDYVFNDPEDVINHILSNLTTDGLKIEVEPLEERDSKLY